MPTPKAPVAQSRSKFAEFVRRTEFNLDLTGQMIASMKELHINPIADNLNPTAMHGLEKRGLVEYISPPETDSELWDDQRARFTLSEQGEKVVDLLILAGFFKRREG